MNHHLAGFLDGIERKRITGIADLDADHFLFERRQPFGEVDADEGDTLHLTGSIKQRGVVRHVFLSEQGSRAGIGLARLDQ